MSDDRYSYIQKRKRWYDKEVEVTEGELEQYSSNSATWRNLRKALNRYYRNPVAWADQIADAEARLAERERNVALLQQMLNRLQIVALPTVKSINEARNYAETWRRLRVKEQSFPSRDAMLAYVQRGGVLEVVKEEKRQERAREAEAVFAEYKRIDEAAGGALTGATITSNTVDGVVNVNVVSTVAVERPVIDTPDTFTQQEIDAYHESQTAPKPETKVMITPETVTIVESGNKTTVVPRDTPIADVVPPALLPTVTTITAPMPEPPKPVIAEPVSVAPIENIVIPPIQNVIVEPKQNIHHTSSFVDNLSTPLDTFVPFTDNVALPKDTYVPYNPTTYQPYTPTQQTQQPQNNNNVAPMAAGAGAILFLGLIALAANSGRSKQVVRR